MTFTVVSFAQYPASDFEPLGGTWRNADYNAMKVVKAIKGEPIKGFAHMPAAGSTLRFDNANASIVANHWATWAAAIIRDRTPNLAGLVPVPNSDVVVGGTDATFDTLRLAQKVALRLGNEGLALPRLRWKQQMTPSRQGGTRNPFHLSGALEVIGTVPRGNIVLIDDVCTSGSHLEVCAGALESAGATVPLAVCAGRTLDAAIERPFAVPDWELRPFDIRDFFSPVG